MPNTDLQIHFLDVGTTKYGDSILILFGQRRILIDAAHHYDESLIAGQLDRLLGTSRPHRLDLLVLTHCHDDHIGCMPELALNGVIKPDRAYLADPDLGWGTNGADAIPDAIDSRVAGVLALLREEKAASLKPAEVDAAIADAAALRLRFERMIQALQTGGTDVVLCTGDENRNAIVAGFSDIGLKIIGPTKAHLLLCAAQLARAQRDATELLNNVRGRDTGASSYELLQQIAAHRFGQDGPILKDGFDEGSALNCQSIVLALEYGGKKVLLAGDMQLAEPDVDDLDAEMAALRTGIAAAGPFDVFKTCHHTSHNGWDDAVGDEMLVAGRAVYLVHSGGINDAKHPAELVLNELRNLRSERGDLTYLRTDRNGQISFTLKPDGTIEYVKARGRINNFQINVADETVPAVVSTRPVASLPSAVSTVAGDFVEVVARIPHRSTRVTITIDVNPAGAASVVTGGEGGVGGQPDPVLKFSLPAGRTLPPLLFVTDEAALGRKIGPANAKAVLNAVELAEQAVFNEPLAGRNVMEAAAAVQRRIQPGIRGVVLLGGADVVPAVRLDVLGPDLRPRLNDPDDDPDHFIVWNDEIYGDTDGDQLAEIPVSRIPDGGSAALLSAALSAAAHTATTRFGVRNMRRPFAGTVFQPLPGNQALLISGPTQSTQVRPKDVQSDLIYLMLHGDDTDTLRFWGESAAGLIEGFSVAQVPGSVQGVVFAGCCWGALTTVGRALYHGDNDPVECRTVGDSIPLRFLAAGAQAFVGCTGVHYSPGGNQTQTAGGPMHVAFFARLLAGHPPAEALFYAKQDCLAQLDPNTDPEELGISLKIIRQFTCLGLGW